jgi:hypothetical protein
MNQKKVEKVSSFLVYSGAFVFGSQPYIETSIWFDAVMELYSVLSFTACIIVCLMFFKENNWSKKSKMVFSNFLFSIFCLFSYIVCFIGAYRVALILKG